MSDVSAVIDTLFGDSLTWDETRADVAYLRCPGAEKHTHKTGRKDTRLFLDGVPTVFCLHQKCADDVSELNNNLRGALDAAGWESPPMSDDQRARARTKNNNKRTAERLRDNRGFIFKEYAWPVSKVIDEGDVLHPNCLTLEAQQNLFLRSLFSPLDIIWAGYPHQTGPTYSSWFNHSSWWIGRRNFNPFVCPNPFKPDTLDRRVENLSDKRYFVIEGDDCADDPDENRNRCGAIFRYAMHMHPELKLRAVVDAGNKSLHGWFEYPGEDIYRWCVEVLPAIGADPATMRLAQPVRLPGVIRDNGKDQRLLWISK